MQDVAEKFCTEHKLPASVVQQLRAHLQQHLGAALVRQVHTAAVSSCPFCMPVSSILSCSAAAAEQPWHKLLSKKAKDIVTSHESILTQSAIALTDIAWH